MSGKIPHKVASIASGALQGFHAAPVIVEADMKAGLPGLQIVGMGNKAIDEARQRVRSAITNAGLAFPAQKFIINLAPAELPKDGTHLDLPIALSILVASGQLTRRQVSGALFAGELALDGSLRPIRGALLLSELAKVQSAQRLYLPAANLAQAQLVTSITVIGVQTLQELYQHLKGVTPLSAQQPTPLAPPEAITSPTLDSVIGHEQAKRALVIAAAGRHNILFRGSPGAGKSLLAQVLPSLLPPLSEPEIIEVTKLHSLNSGESGQIIRNPPLQAPHHTATLTSFIGGGLKARPGSLSLAHRGVLLLDELPEYPRKILEALRQPLEDRCVTLSRLYEHVTYPADVLFIATMNPCPCGYLGDSRVACTCSQAQIAAYASRISGPLLDRIDLRMTIVKAKQEHFFNSQVLKNKQQITGIENIKIARKAQAKRYNRSDYYNAYASFSEANLLFSLTKDARKQLAQADTSMNLTSRGVLRILRVARTIADLANSPNIEHLHVAEALQYR